jgi:iron complex transport system ATP-binding protein
MSQPPIIELENISVVRGGRGVLHSLSFRIAAGEHAAILGPNGCGKSTLIKTITRELFPVFSPASRMRLFGGERWHVGQLRTRLGIVTNDDLSLFLSRPVTGREAVLSGFFSSVGLGWYHELTPAMEARAAELLERLEVPHLSERIVGEMSSGELRRVMIARALVHDPQALLLDEPSNSLDVFAQIELRRTMSKLAQSGLALLLVTHHLPDIVPDIERVIFMRSGRIIADGPKEELLTSRRIGELFGAPVRVELENGFYHLLS